MLQTLASVHDTALSPSPLDDVTMPHVAAGVICRHHHMTYSLKSALYRCSNAIQGLHLCLDYIILRRWRLLCIGGSGLE